MQTVRILADGSGWGHVGGWGWGMALSAGLVMFSIVALVVWAVVYSSPRSKNRSSEPDVYRLMFETNQPDTKAHPILDAQIDRNRQAVRTVAWEAVAAGRLAGDPVVLARLFWAALHGLVELHLDNKFKPDHDITTLTSEMISALIAGMVPSTYNPA